MHIIKPSQQKSLAGLDDIVADALNGFSILKKVASSSRLSQLEDSLEKGKRYLKIKYPFHCTSESTIMTHNCGFGLSDMEEENLIATDACRQVDSDEVCSDCLELWQSIQAINNLVEQDGFDKDKHYDVKNEIKDIKEYQKHVLRDAQQQISALIN